MPTGLLVYPIGWAVVIAAVTLGMVKDSQGPSVRPVIAYIGYWTASTDQAYASFMRAVRERQPHLLREATFHYVAGSADDEDALVETIRAAVRMLPEVLVAPSGDTALASTRVASNTPIIFSCFIDPLRSGIVRSMLQPGSRTTGISLADWLDGKRLEILREAAPHVRTVAILTDRSWDYHYDGEKRVTQEALRQGMSATFFYARSEAEVDAIMNRTDAATYDAWYVPPTYLAYVAEEKIIGHIRRLGKPGIFGTTQEVERGGLIAYSQDTSFVWNTLADLVARVHAGEDPGLIPVERPRRFVLSVRTGPEPSSSPVAASVIRRADRIFPRSRPVRRGRPD